MLPRNQLKFTQSSTYDQTFAQELEETMGAYLTCPQAGSVPLAGTVVKYPDAKAQFRLYLQILFHTWSRALALAREAFIVFRSLRQWFVMSNHSCSGIGIKQVSTYHQLEIRGHLASAGLPMTDMSVLSQSLIAKGTVLYLFELVIRQHHVKKMVYF